MTGEGNSAGVQVIHPEGSAGESLLISWLEQLVAQHGSDLLLVPHAPASIRLEGALVAVGDRPLSGDEIERLKTAIGVSGEAAHQRASEFSDIRIKRADAEEVFKNRTLPLYSDRTEKAFPGVDQLPANAQGALVSLVFNRGAGLLALGGFRGIG